MSMRIRYCCKEIHIYKKKGLNKCSNLGGHNSILQLVTLSYKWPLYPRSGRTTVCEKKFINLLWRQLADESANKRTGYITSDKPWKAHNPQLQRATDNVMWWAGYGDSTCYVHTLFVSINKNLEGSLIQKADHFSVWGAGLSHPHTVSSTLKYKQ